MSDPAAVLQIDDLLSRASAAHRLLETEFIEAVRLDDPSALVSVMPTEDDGRENVTVVEALGNVMCETVRGGPLHDLLHLLAQSTEPAASVVLEAAAQRYADSQVSRLVLWGAL